MYFATDLRSAANKYKEWRAAMKKRNLRCPTLRPKTSDLAVFKELISSRAYQPFKGSGALQWFVANAGDSLLDVGGNVGLACWSYWFFNQVHKGDCYEPSKGCARVSAHPAVAIGNGFTCSNKKFFSMSLKLLSNKKPLGTRSY